MRIIMCKANLILPAICMVLVSACGGQSSERAESTIENQQQFDSSAPFVASKLSSSGLSVGDPFDIEISSFNLPVVEGGGISLQFDPAVIRIDQVELDTSWEFASRSGVIDNSTGDVSEILFNSFQGKSGTVKIATIRASIVGTGSSPIKIVETIKYPFASNGQAIAMQYVANAIQVD